MKLVWRLSIAAWVFGAAAFFLSAETLNFRTWISFDQQGAGIEAFRVLIPSNWDTRGGIQWVLDNPALPAVAALRIYNPQGTEEVEVFPNKMFFWSDNPTVMSLHPVGSRYFGSEVRLPVSPADYIRTILIPAHRRDAADIRIIEQKSLPELAQLAGAATAFQPGFSRTADGGMVKIEYDRSGRTMEEEIYAVVWSFTFPVQSLSGIYSQTNWYGDYLFSFKAEKGKLAPSAKTFMTIVSSFQVSPLWWSKLTQVVEALIRMEIQRIQYVGQLGSLFSRTGSEIREQDLNAWQERQNAYDRMATDFSRQIRGVDGYYDPFADRLIELPSGYGRAWTNGLGDYIISDSPSYNPNIGSNQNWQEMKQRN